MIQTFKEYQAGVARIFASETGEAGEAVRGSGFLVSDRYLITCAHVVIQALKIPSARYTEFPENPIWLDFPHLTKPIRIYSAEVVIWKPCPEAYYNSAYLDDIAVLRLNGSVNQPTLVPLHICESVHNKPFTIWGFPELNGMESNGSIRARQRTREWLQLQVNPFDNPIYGGFSGAPLAIKENKQFLIAGMVNATESNLNLQTQTGGQGAYAITSDALLEIWNKQGRLISILEDVDLKIILHVYNKSRRKDWNTSPGHRTEQLVVDLYEMDQDNNQYLKDFVRCLIKQPGCKALEPTLREYIEVLKLTKADIKKSYHLRKSPIRTDFKKSEVAPSKLWLVIQNAGTADQYQLESAYFVHNHNGALLESGMDRSLQSLRRFFYQSIQILALYKIFPSLRNAQNSIEVLSVIPHKNIKKKDLKDNLIEVLTNIIEGLPPLDELWIEFFLPFKSLDLAPDSWLMNDELREEPVCLGINYPVMIRVWDRLGYNDKRYPFLPKWQKHWKHTNFLSTCEQSLVCCSSSRDKIIEELGNKNACGLRCIHPLKTHSGDLNLPALLMREGVPIALWVRQDLDECLGKEHFADILDAELGRLPQLIRAKRNADLKDSQHIARHISLLWDDPTNVPPNAPSFSFPT